MECLCMRTINERFFCTTVVYYKWSVSYSKKSVCKDNTQTLTSRHLSCTPKPKQFSSYTSTSGYFCREWDRICLTKSFFHKSIDLPTDSLTLTRPRFYRQIRTLESQISRYILDPERSIGQVVFEVFGHARWRMDWVKVSRRTVRSGVLPPETWSTRLVMPAQPAPGECRSKYK